MIRLLNNSVGIRSFRVRLRVLFAFLQVVFLFFQVIVKHIKFLFHVYFFLKPPFSGSLLFYLHHVLLAFRSNLVFLQDGFSTRFFLALGLLLVVKKCLRLYSRHPLFVSFDLLFLCLDDLRVLLLCIDFDLFSDDLFLNLLAHAPRHDVLGLEIAF